MRKKVLLIDDNEQDVVMLQGHLKGLGLQVYSSTSGEDGLKMVRRLKPDLVLLDLILPDIDGFDVCEEIKKDASLRKTKVVIISVKGDVEKVGKVLHVGADDYIVKTLVGEIPDDLDDKLKLHLGMK